MAKLGFLSQVKETSLLWAWSALKIPLITFVGPRIIENSDERCEVVIPLNWKTKNHLGSMYFGVLCTGADIAGGMLAMQLIQKSGKRISLVFKDFKAEFLKRPTEDVHFISEDGPKVRNLVHRAIESGERVEETVYIYATSPEMGSPAPVAKFELTISLKQRT